jgi:hypothetical protein
VSTAFNVAFWALAISFVVIGVATGQLGTVLVVLVFCALRLMRRSSLRSFHESIDDLERRHRTDER